MSKSNDEIRREHQKDMEEGATDREARGLAVENSGRVGTTETVITLRGIQGGNT